MRSVLILLVASACARPAPPPPAPGPATRSVVYARRGMVAAAHPLAVEIGLDVLRRGGSAVDAAIAVNAALGVVEPMMCGIGGDLFAQVWDARQGKLVGLNASGRAPVGISVAKVARGPDGAIPLDSPSSWTVPGAVDGWFTLHGRWGRLPMKELLAPAVRLAEEGAPVPRVIAAEWRREGRAGYAETFLPAPREGAIFRNPGLARSYRLLAEGGADAFYRGPIAAALVAFSRRHGGFLEPEDLRAHRSDWVEPISGDYRGVTIWQLPPGGQGLVVLQMLNILESFDLRAMGRSSADFWHLMIEAKKLAFEDRARHLADPAGMKLPALALLGKEYARARARLIDFERAAARVDPGTPPSDTTYIAVGDAEGNMVSLIQSNFQPCGSGWVPDGLGFCLHDRGAQFSLVPGSPNVLAPGKRPLHTIIPGFATRGGKPWLAFGVMGGDYQPQGQVQVLVNLIDFEMDLQAAGDAPRWRHLGSTEPTGAMTPMSDGGTVFLEPGVPAHVRAELARRGHRIAPGGWFGGYQAVARDPDTGVYAGATESRKDGVALGY